MKIVEQTPTLLKLQKSKFSLIRSYAGLFGLIISGTVFLSMGLLLFYSGSPTTLKCNRVEPTQISCKFTSHTFLGEETTSIRRLEGATVEVDLDSDGGSYRVVVLTEEDNINIPLTDYSTSDEERIRKEASKINNFINNPSQNSLIIENGHNWFMYIIGVFIFLICSPLIIYFIKEKITTICILDKQSGRMYLRRYGILGRETIDCTLDTINRARVEEVDSENNNYDTELVLVSGRKIRLNLDSSTLYASRKVTTSINQFLSLKKS